MQKCKTKIALLLPVDMDCLSGGEEVERNERNRRLAFPKEQMSHT